jgi:hypothetical protein
MNKTRLFPLAALCGLAACTGGGDPPPSSPPATTTTTTAPIVELVPDLTVEYFEALAAGAVPLGLPGSDAAVYAEHQAASRDLLGLTTARSVVAGDQGFEICDPSNACTSYGTVAIDPTTGQVTSFTIDGVPVAGRVVSAGLMADRDGVIARVRSAYLSNGGDVFVVVEIDNTTDVTVEMFGFAAVLEAGVTGAGIEATGAWGSAILESGTSGRWLLQFPGAEMAGHLRLSGLRSDGLDVSLTVRLPTPG